MYSSQIGTETAPSGILDDPELRKIRGYQKWFEK